MYYDKYSNYIWTVAVAPSLFRHCYYNIIMCAQRFKISFQLQTSYMTSKMAIVYYNFFLLLFLLSSLLSFILINGERYIFSLDRNISYDGSSLFIIYKCGKAEMGRCDFHRSVLFFFFI